MSEPTAFSYDALLSKAAAAPVAIGSRPRRGKYDFAVAYPDPASLPLDELMDALAQALAEEGGDLAIYAHPQGYPPLPRIYRQQTAPRPRHPRDRRRPHSGRRLRSAHPHALETLVDPGDVVMTEDFV